MGEDDSGDIPRRAKITLAAIWREADSIPDDDDERKPLKIATAKWWKASDSAPRIRNMIELARSEPGIPVTTANLDRDSFLLNVVNGSIDLRTGELRDQRREDLITRLAPTVFDPTAKCPLWDRFLDRIMKGRVGLIEFLQRLAGLCLTGDVSEQVFPIFYGGGSNGKSTYLDTLLGMMGDYAANAAPDLLTISKDTQHPTEIADLQGRRLIVAQETESGKRLRVGFVKQSTGDSRLKARRMYQDFVEFDRSHKTILSTNNRPVIRESSHAIWRRVRLIPFDVEISEAEQNKHLLDDLRSEWPGILAWCVRGCLAWQEEGLPTVDEITEATASYRCEEDLLAPFIEGRCTVGKGLWVERGRLFKAYRDWAECEGLKHPWGNRTFYGHVRGHGFRDAKKGTGERVFEGLGLKA